MTNFDDPQYRLGSAVSKLSARVKELESSESAIFEIKTTAGNPTAKGNYHFVINTADNTLNCYADGGWRQLANW